MPWTSLSTRFGSTTPLVLAGPILRKVTPTSVTVWLALKQAATVTLNVLSTDAAGAVPLFSSNQASTVAVGPRLHLIAVTARAGGRPPLVPGQRYFYDLSFDIAGASLTLAGAVRNDTAVFAYSPLRLPSFELPPADINHLRLMQGSCRKPNAVPPDAMAILDQEIGLSIAGNTTRPHQLLLGGDQIYADEVADVLLFMLSDAAKLLVGPETMPTTNGFVVAESLLPTSRTPLIEQAGFSSADTRSHLMSFGEYLAMYLFVWSDVLWPAAADFPNWQELSIAGLPTRDIVAFLDDMLRQRENVMAFATTVRKARRALANIPTYMILDDHEITDDFNMSRRFCESVYGSPLGMRVMRNGLAAYALCQHWGNAPEQFEPSTLMPATPPAGMDFLNAFATAAGDPAGFDATLRRVLGLHPPAQMAAQTPFSAYHDPGTRVRTAAGEWLDAASLLFHYSIEGPGHQIVVTDSRTWRSFPRLGLLSAPDLIAAAQLDVQIGGTPALGNRQLLVVFTTNFPPCPGIRQGGRDLPRISESFADEDFYDSWDVPRVDYGRALAAMSRKFPPDASGVRAGRVVVLSGDVHTSSASRIHYRADVQQTDDAPDAPTKADLVVGQLIASGLNNGSSDTRGQHTAGYHYVPPKIVAQIAVQSVLLTEQFIGWNPRTTPDGTPVATYRVSVAGRSQDDAPRPFAADESIITLRDENLSVVWSTQLQRVLVPPHFRIRLDYLKSAAGSHDAYTPPVIDNTNPLVAARDRALATKAYQVNVRDGQFIVGRNNIGEVNFTVDPTAAVQRKARFTVRWANGDVNEQVRFDIPLDATNDIARYPGEP